MRSVVPVAGGLGPAPPQPLDQRRQPETVVDGGGVQPLADVPQVGELPLAATLGQQPGRQVLLGRRHLEQRGHAALGEQPGPASEASRRARSVSEPPPAASSAAVRPRNGVSAAARTRPERCGCSSASSSTSQSSPAGVA